MERSNRHPADRLTDLRERIRQLEAEEAELGSAILMITAATPSKRMFASQNRKRVDLEELRFLDTAKTTDCVRCTSPFCSRVSGAVPGR